MSVLRLRQIRFLSYGGRTASLPSMRDLLRKGLYSDVIYKFEQPNLPFGLSGSQRTAEMLRFQSDPNNLTAYVTALKESGRGTEVANRLGKVFGQETSFPFSKDRPLAAGAAASADVEQQLETPLSSKAGREGPRLSSPSPMSGSEKPFWVSTPLAEWQKRIEEQQRDGGRGAFSPRSSQMPSPPPIPVIVTETFSWGKLFWKIGSVLLWWFLIMSSVGILMEQQGIGKSNIFSEVEPTDDPNKKILFKDVQGVDEAKAELEEVVDFLKEPHKFIELGGKLPKGVLLYGPPGTGKTYLAKAVAGEAGVPFIQISGSEFDEMYVGLGARRVRELFAAAKKKAPCIIFIDELDAVGSARNAKDQSYLRQTLNQLLVELDGFSSSDGVIVIAATNTPNSLDKALVRPGRFDRHVPVPLPDVRGRTAILKVHMKDVQMSPQINPEVIARGTPGFSGAEIANLVNQAAIKASKENARFVTTDHLEWAKDKIMMGSERRSAVISPHNKKITAYHEGGHALVSLYTDGSMPLHKVTVIPRGQALGVTMQLPSDDQISITKKELNAKMDVCMGGRVAEELIFGSDNITTGASNDFQQATDIAQRMITNYGMSEKYGLVTLSDSSLEKSSSETRSIVEMEMKRLLDNSYGRAVQILEEHRVELDRLADALLEYETLNVDEIKRVIKGLKLESNNNSKL